MAASSGLLNQPDRQSLDVGRVRQSLYCDGLRSPFSVPGGVGSANNSLCQFDSASHRKIGAPASSRISIGASAFGAARTSRGARNKRAEQPRVSRDGTSITPLEAGSSEVFSAIPSSIADTAFLSTGDLEHAATDSAASSMPPRMPQCFMRRGDWPAVRTQSNRLASELQENRLEQADTPSSRTID